VVKPSKPFRNRLNSARARACPAVSVFVKQLNEPKLNVAMPVKKGRRIVPLPCATILSLFLGISPLLSNLNKLLRHYAKLAIQIFSEHGRRGTAANISPINALVPVSFAA